MNAHSLHRISIGMLIVTSIFFGFVLASLFTETRSGMALNDGRYPLDGPKLNETNGSLPPSNFMQIAEQMGDVVVNIDARTSKGPLDSNESEGMPRGGSGIILDSQGYILTNWHVVENANKVIVQLKDASSYNAEVVGADSDTDLALLKIKPRKELRAAALGNSDRVRPGEWVVAIGNPSSLDHSVTVGVVSAIGRSFMGNAAFSGYIQTDAAINPGNSGGPLMNIRGEVIGINTLILQQRQNLGFAIPINLAKLVIEQLKEKGKVERGYMGLTPARVTEEIREIKGLPNLNGAIVDSVQEYMPRTNIETPAWGAGLKAGDVITRFDGEYIDDVDELYLRAAYTPPGKRVQVEILREGRPITVQFALASRQPLTNNSGIELPTHYKPSGNYPLGIEVGSIDSATTRKIVSFSGDEMQTGVEVLNVEISSPAYDRDLRKGLLITSVNDEPVNSAEDFRRAVETASQQEKPIVLYVLSNGQFGMAGRHISIPKQVQHSAKR